MIAYSDYAAAVKKSIYLAGRTVAARGIGTAQPIELDEDQLSLLDL